MRRYLFIYGFALLLLCSCSGHTLMDSDLPGTDVTDSPSPNMDENVREELSEQALLDILLSDGIEAIPDFYAVSQCQTQADDLNITAISVKAGEDSSEKYNIFLRLEQNGDTRILPLVDNPMAFRANELAVSTLDNVPVIGIAGKSGDTLMMHFYAIRANSAMTGYSLDNHNPPDDRIMVTGNHVAITDASGLNSYPGKEPVLFQIESDTEYRYAVMHEYEWYTENKAYTLTFMDSSWVLRAVEEQYARLYDAYEAYSFDESISGVLEENTDKLLQKPWSLPLPDDYAYLDICKGDLNGDGLEDIAVVIEQRPGMESGSRMLYIMLAREDGSFHVCWQSNSHLLGRGEGGVFGDPFESIHIENGKLSISHYGGSSYRWGFTYTYAIQDDDLVLVFYSELEHSTHTACGTKTTYDTITGDVEKRSDPFGDSTDGLLLFSSTVEPERQILFNDEANDPWMFSTTLMNDSDPPLPSLDRVQFGEPAWEEPAKLSASQALDIVKNSLFPTMEKHSYQYSKEIMDNYKSLLCYEIPSYYYTDGSTTLFYWGQSDPLMYAELFHCIRVRTPDDDWGVEVRINDSTGKVESD